MIEDDMIALLAQFALDFMPDIARVRERQESSRSEFPLASMLLRNAVLVDETHIIADLDQDAGDPDGRDVFLIANELRDRAPEIDRALNQLVEKGLDVAAFVDFVLRGPRDLPDRATLVRQGVEAHFRCDYVKAIHVLIPQVEAVLRNLLHSGGMPMSKPHRTGRGVMQYKNLNDILSREDWPEKTPDGETLRLYLLAALAHPKGLNVRNSVCHGLWAADKFTPAISALVLHALLSVSMLPLPACA